MPQIRLGLFAFALVVASLIPSPALPQSGIQENNTGLSMTAVSSRPDTVSGGDVLVRVNLPPDAAPSQVVIRLNGTDVTSAFRPHPQERALLGLVTALNIGPNRLEAVRTGDYHASAELVLTNHPITGPIFSGPQEQPYICQTDSFQLPDGSPLGPPLDVSCSVETVVSYVYRSTTDPSGFKALSDLTQLPSDSAWTTTSVGARVPYVVRVETGTINRAIYQIAVLHDPTTEPAPTPFVQSRAWNGRLLFSFGGGCIGGWYRQGTRVGGNGSSPGLNMVTDAIVGKGYAHTSSTLNVFGINCNDVIAAETMMMVKEHFVETYGEPLFTFGRGGSGGAYQQIQIADNYPGLLDGIIPGATFPDVLATIQFLTDIQLLDRYFVGVGDALRPEQKQAIAGVGNLRTVATTAPGADRIKAPGVCPAELPLSLRYSPIDNPTGARCNVFDHTVNVYGRDPVTGFARRPIDNTGVQYGLAALKNGTIDVDQFLDLNERIGGYDNDGNYVAARTVADPEALAAAYKTGRIVHGGGGLATVPIIDSRNFLDMKPAGDLHLKYHSFSLRERLKRANGTTANQVLLVTGPNEPPGFDAYTIAKMDEWLTNLNNTASSGPMIDRIARARPPDLVDSCYAAAGERIIEPQTFTGGQCNDLYPTFPSPRMAAGGPVTNDVLKCQLKPVEFRDYDVEFTDEQKARLLAVFPGGVCDWRKPGVGQGAPVGTWLSY